MVDPSDRRLVLRARRGDGEAFGNLVRRYQTSVYNVCFRMVGERREAEDMTQEAFLRAHERLHTFDEDRPFGPWMRRVAANICLNHLKRFDPPRMTLDDEFDVPAQQRGLDPEEESMRLEQAVQVRKAILELPPHFRAVIELRHFQELSYAQISEALGIPLSDVKSHLYRARRSLVERLVGNE